MTKDYFDYENHLLNRIRTRCLVSDTDLLEYILTWLDDEENETSGTACAALEDFVRAYDLFDILKNRVEWADEYEKK